MDFFIVTNTSTWALEAMLRAEVLKRFDRGRPVDSRRPRCLVQMFQREQGGGRVLFWPKFDVGELPPPIAATVRLPILIQKRQHTEHLRLLQTRLAQVLSASKASIRSVSCATMSICSTQATYAAVAQPNLEQSRRRTRAPGRSIRV